MKRKAALMSRNINLEINKKKDERRGFQKKKKKEEKKKKYQRRNINYQQIQAPSPI